MRDKKVLLVGCGKMGFALLKGMVNVGILLRNVIVIDPSPSAVHDNINVKAIRIFDQETIEEFAPDIIILAVKPQIIESILPYYRQFAGRALFISIIAGKTIAFFEEHLGSNVAIMRAMPNLPVAALVGATVFFENQNVTQEMSQFPQVMFESVGKVFYIDKKSGYDESILNAVTAISGSGPAYVFYYIECYPELAEESVEVDKFDHFVECLKQAALKLDIKDQDALALVKQTVSGSITLLRKSGKSAAALRRDVTSPGGTTEAALKILMAGGANATQGGNWRELVVEATQAACTRSQELSE
jgi:pyrroline-5-carboxylate reductase